MTAGGRLPKVGDIIYSRNASLGAAARVSEQILFCMGQDVCLIRPTDIHSEYLEFLLNSSGLGAHIEELLLGSTIRRVNVDDIRGYPLPLPTPVEQQDIARFAARYRAAIKAVEASVEAAMAKLKEYRSALIATATTGVVRVS
jgi:type I restriction enzyme S subunit